jgi:hypothetical protein
MTLTFHLYHDGIEVEPAPLYARDLEAYKRDSSRALNESKRRRGKWINTFLNCISLYARLARGTNGFNAFVDQAMA